LSLLSGLNECPEDRPFSFLAALDDGDGGGGGEQMPSWRTVVPSWLDAHLAAASSSDPAVAALILHYLHSHALPPGCRLESVAAAAELVTAILASSHEGEWSESSASGASSEEGIVYDGDALPSVSVLKNLLALCRQFAELEAIQQEFTAIGRVTF
jgi:hypothetical protein